MADPVQQQIIEAVKARLETIATADGFHTDAGARVYLGRPIDSEVDTLPALVVWVPEPVKVVRDGARGHMQRDMQIVIEGVVSADSDAPLVAAIQVADDIKRALYTPGDLRLVKPNVDDLELVGDEYFPPDDGRTATGQVTIRVPFTEKILG